MTYKDHSTEIGDLTTEIIHLLNKRNPSPPVAVAAGVGVVTHAVRLCDNPVEHFERLSLWFERQAESVAED
jgi:hypothetical protein